MTLTLTPEDFRTGQLDDQRHQFQDLDSDSEYRTVPAIDTDKE